jgi:hypothetical protein
MKINIGCGHSKRKGFIGIDTYKTPATDMVVELLQFPWPLESDSIEEVYCEHFFERVPKELRGKFMDELHRVMKFGAKATFVTACGDRALQDARHEWPPIVAGSYLYYNRKWREDNHLQHGFYDLSADFDFSYAHALASSIADKDDEFKDFAVIHYNNAVKDLHAVLTKL